jgi:hypothetical protein
MSVQLRCHSPSALFCSQNIPTGYYFVQRVSTKWINCLCSFPLSPISDKKNLLFPITSIVAWTTKASALPSLWNIKQYATDMVSSMYKWLCACSRVLRTGRAYCCFQQMSIMAIVTSHTHSHTLHAFYRNSKRPECKRVRVFFWPEERDGRHVKASGNAITIKKCLMASVFIS